LEKWHQEGDAAGVCDCEGRLMEAVMTGGEAFREAMEVAIPPRTEAFARRGPDTTDLDEAEVADLLAKAGLEPNDVIRWTMKEVWCDGVCVGAGTIETK
jgi:acetyl-CoA acetyltransferase